MAISPFFPMASICLEKIYLKLISLPIDVKIDVSVASDIAGIAFLIFYICTQVLLLNVVAQLPVSKKIILLPFF